MMRVAQIVLVFVASYCIGGIPWGLVLVRDRKSVV